MASNNNNNNTTTTTIIIMTIITIIIIVKETRVHESCDEIFRGFKLDVICANRPERRVGEMLATIFVVGRNTGLIPLFAFRRRSCNSRESVRNSKRNKYSWNEEASSEKELRLRGVHLSTRNPEGSLVIGLYTSRSFIWIKFNQLPLKMNMRRDNRRVLAVRKLIHSNVKCVIGIELKL